MILKRTDEDLKKLLEDVLTSEDWDYIESYPVGNKVSEINCPQIHIDLGDYATWAGVFISLIGAILAFRAITVANRINLEQRDLNLKLNKPQLHVSFRYQKSFIRDDKVDIFVEILNSGSSSVEKLELVNDGPPIHTFPLNEWNPFLPVVTKRIDVGETKRIPWISFTKDIYRDFYRVHPNEGEVSIQISNPYISDFSTSLKYEFEGQEHSLSIEEHMLVIHEKVEEENKKKYTSISSKPIENILTFDEALTKVRLIGDFKVSFKNSISKDKTENILFERNAPTFYTPSPRKNDLDVFEPIKKKLRVAYWNENQEYSVLESLSKVLFDAEKFVQTQIDGTIVDVCAIDLQLADGSCYRIWPHGEARLLGSNGIKRSSEIRFLIEVYTTKLQKIFWNRETILQQVYDESSMLIDRRNFISRPETD